MSGRTCCWTALHGPDCGCWKCLALGHELEIIRRQPTTFDLACERADRERFCRRRDNSSFVSHRRENYGLLQKPAPQVTVEALVVAVRIGGLAALDKPINKQRFSELSSRQRGGIADAPQTDGDRMTAASHADIDSKLAMLSEWQSRERKGRQVDAPSVASVASVAWPVMDEAAYQGLAGDVVRTIGPHSEADPVAIVVQFLAMAANAIGRVPYYQIESATAPRRVRERLPGEFARW
jgi:hypothetical protein